MCLLVIALKVSEISGDVILFIISTGKHGSSIFSPFVTKLHCLLSFDWSVTINKILIIK